MSIFRLATAALVAFALWAPATASSAAASETYHGRFTSAVYIGCGTDVPTAPASGTWNVIVTDKQVTTATFNIFVDGVHHLAYGVPGLPVTLKGSGWSFQFQTAAGLLVVSWDGSVLRYVPNGYSYGGLTCERVTYLGA